MSYVFPEPKKIPFLKAAFIFLLLSLFGLIMNRFFLQEKNQAFTEQPLQVRVLKFIDLPDGGVEVIDAKNNQVVDVVQGEAGFVRGILRTIARERRIRGLDSQDPVELKAYNNGRLLLQDPLTNTTLELESFGAGNAASFKQFLEKNNS